MQSETQRKGDPMTDRVNRIVVALERDVREDDVAGLVEAIKHLRGVVDATAKVVSPEAWAVEARVRVEIQEKVFNVFLGEQ